MRWGLAGVRLRVCVHTLYPIALLCGKCTLLLYPHLQYCISTLFNALSRRSRIRVLRSSVDTHVSTYTVTSTLLLYPRIHIYCISNRNLVFVMHVFVMYKNICCTPCEAGLPSFSTFLPLIKIYIYALYCHARTPPSVFVFCFHYHHVRTYARRSGLLYILCPLKHHTRVGNCACVPA